MRYKLVEDGRVLHTSADINRLINFTVKTKNAMIYYGDVLVWVQRP